METIEHKPLPAADIVHDTAQNADMNGQHTDTDAQHTGPENADDDKNLDLVRKILFGEQVRETERRQASLERYIQESVEALNKETQQQIQALKSDLQALLNAFEEEVGRQNNKSAGVAERFTAIAGDISKTAAQAQREYRELDQRLTREAERLSSQSADWRREILTQLEQTSQRLQHDKADRQSIADLLHGMARQISADNEPEKTVADDGQ